MNNTRATANADTFLTASQPQRTTSSNSGQGVQVARNIFQQGVYDGRYARYDGQYMGAGQQFFDGNTVSLANVPAVTPTNRAPNGAQVIYVNGIDTDPRLANSNMQQFANQTGASVRGVYNATFGIGSDIGQSALDLVQLSSNKAERQLTQTIYHTVRQPGSAGNMHLVLESQGAIVGSNALRNVRDRLLDENGYRRWHAPWDGDQRQRNENALRTVDAMMGKIKVETYGGAAPEYPYGPRYVHFARTTDVVAFNLGVNESTQLRHVGGDRAVVALMPSLEQGALNDHLFRKYVPDRVDNPFGDFYERNRGQVVRLQ